MFGIGFQELVVIFLIILLIFGAKKLPEIGRSMGRTLTEFRKGMKEAEKSFREVPDEEEKEKSGTKAVGQEEKKDSNRQDEPGSRRNA